MTEAVLITGVYGSGKSSMAAEIADILEKRGDPYAYLDLDFLCWGYPGSDDEGAGERLLLSNLRPVVANYLEAGARYFILAGFYADGSELQRLKDALAIPLRVVRLTVDLEDIEGRLRADVTSGRQDDLREAALQLAASDGVGLEDLAVRNDGPLGPLARRIVEWLGWT